jgi:hypothetical protein
MTCRVCGSEETSTLPIGQYADFFSLRIDTSKDKFRVFSRANSIRIKPMPLPNRALRKIGRVLNSKKVRQAEPFRTYMQGCASCHAITPSHEYSFLDLQKIYGDYRSETYTRDRISVEPTYAQIAKEIGSHPLEIENRNTTLNEFLGKNENHFSGRAMLDFGGSDGRLIPSFIHRHFEAIHIVDPSAAPVHPSVDATKVKKISEPRPAFYSLLTCMQVLEHVGNPRALVIDATQFVAPGGLIYLEVPHELTLSVHEDFTRRIIDTPIVIHEHLNLFDRMSMHSLIESIDGLELIDEAEENFDIGWIIGSFGRFLAKKVN